MRRESARLCRATQFGLELLDVMAERRLRQEQPLCRLAHRAALGNHLKLLELEDIHARPLLPIISKDDKGV